MHILPLYAALLALLFVALSIRIIRLRRSLRIALGDAGNEALLRAISVHANFAEYAPLCLILLYLVEGQGAHPALLHGLGVILLTGRLSHAFGVSQPNENFRFRVFGMALTFTTIITSSAYLLVACWL
ncbi:MAG: glutathione metabolism protein [Synechococcaceae cyanobacterium SM1_2_3]|nr:glutathione metabolism protein [Synechococcaceae cyanobacterium SM1_2_3]